MKVIGLFSGVGGIELGFKKAGFDLIWSNEIDERAAKTFILNFKHKLVVDDIDSVDINDIPDHDVLVAGFPCQAFSIAGLQQGFKDARGNCFFSIARILEVKQPPVFFLENVKNLKGHDKGKTYKVIESVLKNLGYHITSNILNASEYANIPQNRERIFIIGFKNKMAKDRFEWPEKVELTTKFRDFVNSKTVDQKYYYSSSNFKHFNTLKKEATDKTKVYQWRRVYLRENKNGISPTLTANMGTGGHNVPIILDDFGLRKLTPRETFNLQGYDKTFLLPSIADSHLYKQAGNSVVVPLIQRIAENIMKSLKP